MSSSMDPLLPPGYSSSLRIRNADSLSYLGEKRVLEKREVGGGINSFEESLKTKRSCRGMCNYEGLRNYGGGECCFQLAFLSFWRVLFYYREGGGW